MQGLRRKFLFSLQFLLKRKWDKWKVTRTRTTTTTRVIPMFLADGRRQKPTCKITFYIRKFFVAPQRVWKSRRVPEMKEIVAEICIMCFICSDPKMTKVSKNFFSLMWVVATDANAPNLGLSLPLSEKLIISSGIRTWNAKILADSSDHRVVIFKL